jgi:hypothetical protein
MVPEKPSFEELEFEEELGLGLTVTSKESSEDMARAWK